MKLRVLLRLLGRFDIVLIQEAHMAAEDLDTVRGWAEAMGFLVLVGVHPPNYSQNVQHGEQRGGPEVSTTGQPQAQPTFVTADPFGEDGPDDFEDVPSEDLHNDSEATLAQRAAEFWGEESSDAAGAKADQKEDEEDEADAASSRRHTKAGVVAFMGKKAQRLYKWEQTILQEGYLAILTAQPGAVTLSTTQEGPDVDVIGYESVPMFHLIHLYGDPYTPGARAMQRQAILQRFKSTDPIVLIGDLNVAHRPVDRYYPDPPHFRPENLKGGDVKGYDEPCAQLVLVELSGDGGYDLVHKFPSMFSRSTRAYSNMAGEEIVQGVWHSVVLTEMLSDTLSDYAPYAIMIAPLKDAGEQDRLHFYPAWVLEVEGYESMVREITERFVRKELGIELFNDWAARRLRGELGPNYGKALPTPEWWLTLPDARDPLHPAALQRPEDVWDAVRYAMNTVVAVVNHQPVRGATTTQGKRRVLLTLIEIATVKRRRPRLDDLLSKLVRMLPAVEPYVQRWLTEKRIRSSLFCGRYKWSSFAIC